MIFWFMNLKYDLLLYTFTLRALKIYDLLLQAVIPRSDHRSTARGDPAAKWSPYRFYFGSYRYLPGEEIEIT